MSLLKTLLIITFAALKLMPQLVGTKLSKNRYFRLFLSFFACLSFCLLIWGIYTGIRLGFSIDIVVLIGLTFIVLMSTLVQIRFSK